MRFYFYASREISWHVQCARVKRFDSVNGNVEWIDRWSSLISHKFGICQLRIADGTILIADYLNRARKTIDNKNGFWTKCYFHTEKMTKHTDNVMHDEFICFGSKSKFVIIQNDRNLLFFRCFSVVVLFSSSASLFVVGF